MRWNFHEKTSDELTLKTFAQRKWVIIFYFESRRKDFLSELPFCITSRLRLRDLWPNISVFHFCRPLKIFSLFVYFSKVFLGRFFCQVTFACQRYKEDLLSCIFYYICMYMFHCVFSRRGFLSNTCYKSEILSKVFSAEKVLP